MASQGYPTPFGELKALLDDKGEHSDLDVFNHCLGLDTIRTQPSRNPEIARIRSIADHLAENITVLCIDTEHYTLNSDEMTEIGIAVMNTHDVHPLAQAKKFGEHGEILMRQTKFHFWRLLEKTHLHSTNKASRGPAGNRFGDVRFVSFADARKFLRELMNKPIMGVKGLEGYNHPIVILGHSIGHDREHLNGKDLALCVGGINTIVRYIDTQAMTVEAGRWWGSKDPIGLKTLVQKLEFEHTDSHTAANDAARTLMCAILLALPMEANSGCTRTVNEVATDLERYSQESFVGMGGSARYCCDCSSTEHMFQDCDRVGSLLCDECVARGFDDFSTTHIALHCPIVRDEVVAERLAWYAAQPQHWQPKHAFSSKNRLKTFAEVPDVRVQPTSLEEFTKRREFYDMQRALNRPFKAFIWSGRSFKNSPLRNGPPPGQRISNRQNRPTLVQPGGLPVRQRLASGPPPAPAFNTSDFPALPTQNPSGSGTRGGLQHRGPRGGHGASQPGLSRDNPGREGSFSGGVSGTTSTSAAPRAYEDTPIWGAGRAHGRGRGGRGRGT